MQVPLRDMPTERNFALEPDFIRDALAGAPGQSALEAPAGEGESEGAAEPLSPGEIQVELSVSLENDSAFARGSIAGWIHVACSRCLEPVRLDVNETVQTTFLPHVEEGGEVEAGDEVELNEDDLDVSTYKGEEIDLSDVIRDQLVLAVPFAPLCREDCAGIQGDDGAGWSFKTEEQAAAEPKPEDPRFAVLKNLKLD